MSRLLLAALAFTLACDTIGAPHVGAQQPAPLAAGMRVRVSIPGLHPNTLDVRTGTLLALDSQSVVVQPTTDRTAWTLPFVSIRKLEVSKGSRPPGSRILVGALVGLGAGAALGYATASQIHNDDHRLDWPYYERTERRAKRVRLLFSVGGFVAGAVVGGASTRDRWVQVPIPPGR